MSDILKEKLAGYDRDRDDRLEALLQDKSKSRVADQFAKYAHKTEISVLLAKHELYKKIIDTRGAIIECGVYEGVGLFTWAQLSAIHEPLGVWRHIYGFDTFEGFPSVHDKDVDSLAERKWEIGDLKSDSKSELEACLDLLERSPYPPKFPKVELVKGDFAETGEAFLKDNPHIIISLLYLDFDLYESTKKAIELFLPRMPKGSVIAFDELNHHRWPGETLAFLETMNIRECEVKTLPYFQRIAYIVL
jgi:hypothetical protein